MRVLLLLGSNQHAQRQMAAALSQLRMRFAVLQVSLVHQSVAEGGIAAPAYSNQAVIIDTDLQRQELKAALREIESTLGRQRPSPNPQLCPIDIDSVGAWQPEFLVWDAKSYESEYAHAPMRDLGLPQRH